MYESKTTEPTKDPKIVKCQDKTFEKEEATWQHAATRTQSSIHIEIRDTTRKWNMCVWCPRYDCLRNSSNETKSSCDDSLRYSGYRGIARSALQYEISHFLTVGARFAGLIGDPHVPQQEFVGRRGYAVESAGARICREDGG